MGRLGPTQFSYELHGLEPKRRDCIWTRLFEAQYVQVRGHWAGPLARPSFDSFTNRFTFNLVATNQLISLNQTNI
jgi:hypothetical protein